MSFTSFFLDVNLRLENSSYQLNFIWTYKLFSYLVLVNLIGESNGSNREVGE